MVRTTRFLRGPRPVLAAVGLATLVAPPPAGAQEAGTPLWSVELDHAFAPSQPTVGPDGTIYAHAGAFYAISPDGAILWARPLPDANVSSVGLDGTVYAGSNHTVHAFTPAGDELWTFTEPPGGQGLMAGPSVGPDGNVYAVTDFGGLGALSLTPQGALRWSTPGFANLAGTGLSRVQFAPDRLFFSEDWVPGCDPDGLQQGVVAVLLDDGGVAWCEALSDTARSMAAPGGRAYQRFGGGGLRAYEADGAVAWTFALPPPNNVVVGPGVGPDGAAYLLRNNGQLWRVGPDGAGDWTVSVDSPGGFARAPAIAPDNSALVFGFGAGIGENGTIQARDPLSGAALWSLPVSGTTAGAAAVAEFSPDGRVAYVPVNTVDTTVLLAVQVRDAEPIDGDLDGNGRVDVADLVTLVLAWGPCAEGRPCPADLDGDGRVAVEDLVILISSWG